MPLLAMAAHIHFGGRSVALICLLLVINGLATAPVLPTFVALLPRLTGREKVISINSVLSLLAGICAIGGPLLATILSKGQPSLAFVIISAIMLVAALGSYRLPRNPSTENADRKDAGLAVQLKQGLQEVLAERWILIVIACFMLINIAFTGFQSVVGPIVAAGEPGIGAEKWGVALAIMGLGMLIASVTMFRLKPRRPLVVGLCCVTMIFLPPAVLWLLPSAPILFASFLLAGFGLEAFTICWTSSLQLNVPTEKLGRVAALDAFGSYAGAPIGAGIAGVLFGIAGNILLAVTAAVLLLASVIPLLFSSVRNVRGYPAPANARSQTQST